MLYYLFSCGYCQHHETIKGEKLIDDIRKTGHYTCPNCNGHQDYSPSNLVNNDDPILMKLMIDSLITEVLAVGSIVRYVIYDDTVKVFFIDHKTELYQGERAKKLLSQLKKIHLILPESN